jgi:hypothetical protein
MSTATMGSMRSRGGGRSDERGSTVWFWLIVVAVLALIAFLVAWLGGWIRFTTDPRVTEILVMQDEARAKFAAGGGPTTLADATAAVAAMNAIRQKVDALPERLRPQVERSGGGMMRDMFRGRIDAYFAAPPEQRRAELDRQIDQEEIMRKAFEAGSAVVNAVGGGRQRSSGGGGGGGGPPRGGSQDDRNRWRKNMIDRTTPAERERYSEYRRAMEERRQERGLPSGGPR